jgi:hypothetical protein
MNFVLKKIFFNAFVVCQKEAGWGMMRIDLKKRFEENL